jgi:hypothetical protein
MPEGATQHEQGSAKKPKTVTIEINNKPYAAPKRTLTGLEIKSLADIPADFQLYRLHGNSGQLDPIGNEDEVKLHESERFRAVSGQDVS